MAKVGIPGASGQPQHSAARGHGTIKASVSAAGIAALFRVALIASMPVNEAGNGLTNLTISV